MQKRLAGEGICSSYDEEKYKVVSGNDSRTRKGIDMRRSDMVIILSCLILLVCSSACFNRPLTGIEGLCKASDRGDMESVKRIISEDPKLVHGEDRNGDTPLLHAVVSGQMEVLQYLISKGAKVTVKTKAELTPLHLASQKGHRDIAELLIKRGNSVNAKSNLGQTPLHEAAFYGHMEVVELLVENGADVNATTQRLQTPLHMAVDSVKDHSDIVEFLIQKGARINAKNLNDLTPYRVAKRRNKKETLTILEKYGAKDI